MTDASHTPNVHFRGDALGNKERARGKAVFVDTGTWVNGRDCDDRKTDWGKALRYALEKIGCAGRPDTFIAYVDPNSPRELAACAPLEHLDAQIVQASKRKNDSDCRFCTDFTEYAIDTEGEADVAILGGDHDFSYPVRRMCRRYPEILSVHVLCPRKSIAECWLEPLGWNGKFFPMDEFVSQATRGIRLGSTEAEIVESLSTAVSNGKHPTVRRTTDIVAERIGLDPDLVREKLLSMMDDGMVVVERMTGPNAGFEFDTIAPSVRAIELLASERGRRIASVKDECRVIVK